jgi:hypothetical protein
MPDPDLQKDENNTQLSEPDPNVADFEEANINGWEGRTWVPCI